jgi:hypothetical protein
MTIDEALAQVIFILINLLVGAIVYSASKTLTWKRRVLAYLFGGWFFLIKKCWKWAALGFVLLIIGNIAIRLALDIPFETIPIGLLWLCVLLAFAGQLVLAWKAPALVAKREADNTVVEAIDVNPALAEAHSANQFYREREAMRIAANRK